MNQQKIYMRHEIEQLLEGLVEPVMALVDDDQEFVSAAPTIIRQLLGRIDAMLDDAEAEFLDYSDNLPGFTDYYLRKHGYDPDKLAEDIQARVKIALDNSPLNPKNKDKQ